MPNTMYYQSFSEKLLGGKLHLLDQCHEILKSGAKVQVGKLNMYFFQDCFRT